MAIRTETTINDTRDFRIGRALGNPAPPCEIGFGANLRLLASKLPPETRCKVKPRSDASTNHS